MIRSATQRCIAPFSNQSTDAPGQDFADALNELLESPPHEFRVYGDDKASVWAVVSEEDYLWAIQWRWSVNQPHPKRNGSKRYFRRSMGWGGRYSPPLYLHVEILKRSGEKPPTKRHTIGDHLDGNEHNCRRENLAYATQLKNRWTSRGRNKVKLYGA